MFDRLSDTPEEPIERQFAGAPAALGRLFKRGTRTADGSRVELSVLGEFVSRYPQWVVDERIFIAMQGYSTFGRLLPLGRFKVTLASLVRDGERRAAGLKVTLRRGKPAQHVLASAGGSQSSHLLLADASVFFEGTDALNDRLANAELRGEVRVRERGRVVLCSGVSQRFAAFIALDAQGRPLELLVDFLLCGEFVERHTNVALTPNPADITRVHLGERVLAHKASGRDLLLEVPDGLGEPELLDAGTLEPINAPRTKATKVDVGFLFRFCDILGERSSLVARFRSRGPFVWTNLET